MRSTRYLFSALFTVYRSHCVVLHCHLHGFNVPDEISDRYNIRQALIYGRRKSAGHLGCAFEQLKKAFFPAARALSGAIDLSTVTDYYYKFSSGDFSRSVLIPRSDDDQTPLR